MENLKIKCSIKKHSEIDAINYCPKCKMYLCNKCKNYHFELFEDHHLYDLNSNINELFTSYCKERKHNDELEYYCKTHNQLCCAACIAKIKGEGNGQHSNCNICFIKEIKNEKKDKLKTNIKILGDLFNKLEESINELKKFSQKLGENKESLKENIQKTFTKIRTALNDREDELLIEADKLYNSLFFNEDIIKENKKYKNKIIKSLEEGEKNDKEWKDDNNLILFINNCINIENNINYINEINDTIKKCNLNQKI